MSINKILKNRFNLERSSKVKKSTNSPLSKIVTETRKDPPKISDVDIFRKELVEIAEKSKILSLIEEQEKILVKEEEYKIFQEKKEEDHKIIQEKLTSPFTKNKNVDMKPAIEYAIDKLLPKAYIPEVIEYPEPFQEEPALNRELAEFKKKINTHIHQVGFAGSGGGGIGDIADAGDIDGGTALVNGKFLKYDSSSQKFVGSDAVSNEALQDVVGGMITNNTETNISVTYDDTTGTLDFVVGTLNQNTTGTAATVTGAAQTNITSLGTLTALTVDNIIVNGTNIGHTSDTDSIAIASNGVVTFSQIPVLPANSIDSDYYVDGSIDTAHIADNQITLAKMAGLARGKIIVGDASGDPSVLAPGTNGQVLASDGTDLAFADISVSSLAADNLSAGDAAILLTTSSGNITIDAAANDSDIIIKGTDGSADTTYLTIDGSAAGEATFNAGIVIADAGTIGSASDKDAIAIASNGVVTFSQIPVMPANSIDSDEYIDGSIDAEHLSAGALAAPLQLDGTPGTDHTANGPQTNTFNAGYGNAVMDLVYLGGSSTWLEADSDAVGTSINLLGIALAAVDSGAALNVALAGSFVRDDTFNFTPGVPLYVSGTLGAITATKPTGSGDIVRTVGYAATADVIYFNPSSDYVVLA